MTFYGQTQEPDQLRIHSRGRYFNIGPHGRYTLTCTRCGKETT